MDDLEIRIRQIVQQYLSAHPSATRDELVLHTKRQLGELSRVDWWRVDQTLDLVLKEK